MTKENLIEAITPLITDDVKMEQKQLQRVTVLLVILGTIILTLSKIIARHSMNFMSYWLRVILKN